MSSVYVLACRLFELVVLLGRGERSKELEILVLRHELLVLRRQLRRPQYGLRDWLLLAALSRMLLAELVAGVLSEAGDAAALASAARHETLDVPATDVWGGRRSTLTCAS